MGMRRIKHVEIDGAGKKAAFICCFAGFIHSLWAATTEGHGVSSVT